MRRGPQGYARPTAHILDVSPSNAVDFVDIAAGQRTSNGGHRVLTLDGQLV
ncbi:MAG: hypothetical protein ACLQG3_14015 [Terracidiphilus sp.]